MIKVLDNAIKTQIKSLLGLEFNEFINKLYAIAYGSRFTPIKQKHDKGSDGILDNQISLSVYSPEKYSLNDFKRKVTNKDKEGDFDKYQINWKNKGYKWMFVYNGEITTEMRNFLVALEKDVEIIDINYILVFIDTLEWSKKRSIAEYLSIDEIYFVNDILSDIIDDLIKVKDSSDIIHKKPSYIKDKIELNYSQEDVDTAINEYYECLGYFSKLEGVLPKDNESISALHSKIRRDYLKYNGDFKTRLYHLTEEYSSKYKNDDVYKFYVGVVLIYYFEYCLIGKRTVDEKC